MSLSSSTRRLRWIATAASALIAPGIQAQIAPKPQLAPTATVPQAAQAIPDAPTATIVPMPGSNGATLTLDQAIARAQANEPLLAAARAEQQALALERTNARAAFLPTAIYHNQAIYTQSNGVPASRVGQVASAPAPIFIANNAVREYANQGLFNEIVGFSTVGRLRLATATAAKADAVFEVSRRGLIYTVVSLYFSLGSTAEKSAIGERALTEANRFLDITQKRESAREVAHADVLKAQLAQQTRQRELYEVHLLRDRARLELGVLVYPDPSTPYSVTSLDQDVPPLPDRQVVEQLARQNNPDLRSALASVQTRQAETYTARAALLPDLLLNFTYGIDATSFSADGPDGVHNLGYAMSATLDIPLWDWLSTERRIKESRLRQDAAKVAVTAAQRRLIANLAEFYAEARIASEQMGRLDESVTTAREELRLINMRYVDGDSTVLEVVDAQNALILTETAQIDGRVRYRLALANLQTLTGRL